MMQDLHKVFEQFIYSCLSLGMVSHHLSNDTKSNSAYFITLFASSILFVKFFGCFTELM